MELRVLKYFLMVAREENITKAADLLHITQPTLSRQLMQLEDELGVKLFHRGKYNVTLTEDGMFLRHRAQELVELSDKTIKEISHKDDVLAGEISIGCGETKNMTALADKIAVFQKSYPLVQFNIYSSVASDIKERIEKGLIDIGLLMEPVDVSKYEFIHMPYKEKWGILARKDSALAKKEVITPEDLADIPLLLPRRNQVKNVIGNWFGEQYEKLNIAATYNLIMNATYMVRSNVGIAVCFDFETIFQDLAFIPLSPVLETGAVLVWKKSSMLSTVASQFIHRIKNTI